MGAINNAFNQAVGAATGAALVYQHARESDISQALLGKEQYKELDADINNLQSQITDSKNKWDQAEGDLAILNTKRPGGKGNTKAAIEEKKKAKMSEIDAAKRAFEELSGRIEAKKAMRERAEITMNIANKWGGIK